MAERYSLGDEQVQQEYVGGRRAAAWLPFLLPYPRPGMRLLDVGCGVGSITLDLAKRVAPAETVGIDEDAAQLETARESARRRGISTARFQTGDAYDLPFPDASFDVVVAHTVLLHLSDPPRALRAFRRVLRPGGLVAIADDDWDTNIYSPAEPLMDRSFAIGRRVIEANGGSPSYARTLRRLLLDAGFDRTEGHAVAAEVAGTLEATRAFVETGIGLLTAPETAEMIIGNGWATPEELDAIVQAMRAWGDRPDAYRAILYAAALGWVAPD